VLDANAVLDFVEDGPGAEQVEQLLLDAHKRGAPLLMSVLNWGEVFYHSWQERGEFSARRILADLSRLAIELTPLDLSQVLKAGELKVIHKIPYVDCVAAALALSRHATLVTADRDFEKLGRHFPILWIARP
jgi:predicted nucleic acid-binding protein